MDTNLPLSVMAYFDRKLAPTTGDAYNFLVITTTAPPTDFAHKPGPLNLAIVIDVSDSMGGHPLRAAQRAAAGVVNALSDKDILSLVSFADDKIVHFENLALNRGGKKKAIKELDRLRVRGNTNLSSGWFGGAECVAKTMANKVGCQNHVLVLSDGHANLGIVSPDNLAKHAMELQMRGIITSTVGIGDSYSPAQLRSLAESGGGRIHDAQYPGEIIEVVMAHLRQLEETTVESVKVMLDFPDVQSIENISGFPATMNGHTIEILFGSLLAEATRSCVFKVRVPAGDEGEQLRFCVRSQYQPVGMPVTTSGDTASAELTLAPKAKWAGQARNIELSKLVARSWQACVVSRIVEMNRQHQFKEAVDYLDRQLNKYIAYCEDLEGCDALVDELLAVRRVANVRWDERSRKEMQLATYQTTYNQTDTRILKRGHWSTFLPKT